MAQYRRTPADSTDPHGSEDILIDNRVLEPGAETTTPDNVSGAANWVVNSSILWRNRRFLTRVVVIAFIVSLVIAFIIPKRYKSTAQIMPPDNSGSGAAIFAALAGHALGGMGGLGSLAGSLLGTKNTSALFVDLLRSGTVSGDLIDRFQLLHAYHKRYRVDAAKYLTRHTTIVDDKKSGVITITFEDTDPRRARDIAQGYLDELNLLVNKTSTSSAHRERVFIEQRLKKVEAALERAQQDLSNFSSTHTTIDIKEQTRATVDAAAKLQAQMIVEQSELDSLQQIYGNSNIRVRATQARIAELQRELTKLGGTAAPLQPDNGSDEEGSSTANQNGELYPPLRQLPRLAVPYADLYRRVRVQETVYELLTQQYEIARIQEAKDIPVVSVIDSPGIPEKKSFPPRLLLALLLTLFALGVSSAYIIFRERWSHVNSSDPRKMLAQDVNATLSNAIKKFRSRLGNA